MLTGLLCDFPVGFIPVDMVDPECPAATQFPSLDPCMAMVTFCSILPQCYHKSPAGSEISF